MNIYYRCVKVLVKTYRLFRKNFEELHGCIIFGFTLFCLMQSLAGCKIDLSLTPSAQHRINHAINQIIFI